MEKQEYVIKIKLIGNLQPCHAGHQPGDEWTFDYKTVPDICSLAWNSIYPFVLASRYGAVFPWQDTPDVIQASCPDPEVNNIFEIRRVPRI